MTTQMTRPHQLVRRALIIAREGAMQCPRCSYTLSYSDALLCRVGDTHYCPRCWSRIPDPGELVTHADDAPHDATAKSEGGKEKGDDEAHVAIP